MGRKREISLSGLSAPSRWRRIRLASRNRLLGAREGYLAVLTWVQPFFSPRTSKRCPLETVWLPLLCCTTPYSVPGPLRTLTLGSSTSMAATLNGVDEGAGLTAALGKGRLGELAGLEGALEAVFRFVGSTLVLYSQNPPPSKPTPSKA